MAATIYKTGLKTGGSRTTLAAILLSAAVVLPGVVGSSAAFAQEAADEEDSNEILVTAQRREQAAIDVPIAVSVVEGEVVEKLNLSTFISIAQQTPNFNVTSTRGGNAAPNLSIRGVRSDGSTARVNESSVAVYVDDVYMGDESSLVGSMFDVQRVEVLRGPQGTLFGRNSTGGLLQIISKGPTADFSGSGSVLFGADNWVAINGAVSGPLNDRIRTRLSGQFERHDGHYTNRANFSTLPGLGLPVPNPPQKLGAKDVWSVRSITDLDISDASKFRLSVTYSSIQSESTPNYGLGIFEPLPAAANTLCSRDDILAARCWDTTIRGGQPPQNGRRAGDAITELSKEELAINQDFISVTGKFETEIGAATLINVTNYTRFRSSIGLDGDGGITPSTLGNRVWVVLNNSTKQFSNELRLQGSSDTLSWVAGLFYYQDQKRNANVVTSRNNAGATAATVRSGAGVDTQSGAVFGQADWKFADQFTLTAGLRYSIENRRLVQAYVVSSAGANANILFDVLSKVADPNPTTRDLTGRLSLTWEPTPDNSIYASYSRGAKSVAYSAFYNGGTDVSNALQTGPVGQEHLDAFELGSKNRFFNRTLTLNLAAFYYIFKGKQELFAVIDNPVTAPTVSTTRFLPLDRVDLYGAEIELNFKPNDRWDFSLNAGLLAAEITELALTVRRSRPPTPENIALQGQRLPQTPPWNVSATIAYHIPTDRLGIFTLQAEGRAQAEQNFGLSNDPVAEVPAYGVVNLRVMWESANKKLNAQAFVTNLFNKAYFNSITDTAIATGALFTQSAEPRVWGVKLGASF